MIAGPTISRRRASRNGWPRCAASWSLAGQVSHRIGVGSETSNVEVSVGVTLKPWRVELELVRLAVFVANRHLDLRQALFVEYLVLRDHLVEEEQVSRQRIHLIGSQSPLQAEWHAAPDEIPYYRRIRRAQWQDALLAPEWNIRAFFRLQNGR